jgi:hypothetical protein
MKNCRPRALASSARFFSSVSYLPLTMSLKLMPLGSTLTMAKDSYMNP